MTTVTKRQLTKFLSKRAGTVPNIKPFFSVDYLNDDELAQWFSETIQSLTDDHNALVESQDRKREFYSGLQSSQMGKVGIPRDRDYGSSSSTTQSKLVINKLYNLIELWVAKLTRFAPNVVVNPANSEYGDRVSAKLGKLIADNIAYQNDMDELLETTVRLSRVDGEAFVFTDFDKNWGDYKMGEQEASALSLRVPLTNSEGEQVFGLSGEPLYVDERERLGEVRFNVVDSRFVMLEPKEKYSECDWCFRITVRYVDELKAEFPDLADKITGGNTEPFDFPWLTLSDEECAEITFYHRSTHTLDSGAEIRFVGPVILDKKAYSLRSAKKSLPMARYSGIDLPGILRGVSILDNLMVLQVLYNNLQSIAYTNMSLAAHAYWLVPTQANVSTEKIRNSASVLKFTGPVAPRIETFKTVGPEVFNSIEMLDQLMTQGSGHQGISQGETPPGVDAAIALGVLEEQENQRANPEIKKYNTFIKKIYVLALARAQDNYKSDDGRLLRIVGKNNQDTMKSLDMSKFAGAYDVRVQRSTALSESKNLRLQQLMLMKQNFPTAISDARFLDLMELGDEAKFFDIVAAATRAAEGENERLFAGEPILPPKDYEEHIAHLNVHYPMINTLTFKEDVPDEAQKETFGHIMVHEKKAFELALKNPAFMQELLKMPSYPKFFYPPIPLAKVAILISQGIDVAAQLAGAPGEAPAQVPAEPTAQAFPMDATTVPGELPQEEDPLLASEGADMTTEPVSAEMRPDEPGAIAANSEGQVA